jgi:hypothetical protein
MVKRIFLLEVVEGISSNREYALIAPPLERGLSGVRCTSVSHPLSGL